jgi:hypothetical protein
MLMRYDSMESLCDAACCSISNASDFLYSMQIDDVLDRLWNLQDHLNRIVDMASDRPNEIPQVFGSECTKLKKDVQEVLANAAAGPFAWNPGAKASFENINQLLAKLDTYRPGSETKVLAASS